MIVQIHIFFRKSIFIVQKIIKTTKKYVSHEKIKKLLPGTYILIYVLWSQWFYLLFRFFKNIFWIFANFAKVGGILVMVTVTVTVKKF